MTYKFPEDDDDDVKVKYNFSDRKIADVGKHYNKTPLFAYDFLDLDLTEYHFNQECLDNNDIRSYFRKLKELSQLSIDNMIDELSHKEHFHIYNIPNRRIKNLLLQVLNKKAMRDEEIPPVGQIGLYTGGEAANRETGVKCPRIYFMIGPYAVLYILFYDPYHEINPGKSN